MKELVKGLIEVDMMKKIEHGEKFYFYDEALEKVAERVTNVGQLAELMDGKEIVVSMIPIDEIFNARMEMKKDFRKLLRKEMKFVQGDVSKCMQSEFRNKKGEEKTSIKSIIRKVSAEKNYQRISNSLKKTSEYQGPLKAT